MRNGLRLSGTRLGQPPKDAHITSAHKQQLRADQSRRNEVEGVFGSGKRKYSLDLIMARLKAGSESSISMAFLVMCAEKLLRLLRLFFVLLLRWSYGLVWHWASLNASGGILNPSFWDLGCLITACMRTPKTRGPRPDFRPLARKSFSGVPM